ncbi:aminoglycoside phosphotransferase family protein [Chitinolyticbacter albus]|uniref:aminoglycoside phosphotransferase family protein n=1 Tax=Chitinolyticbacter albus TaxID=2961951 RepID=UPI00210BA0E8|nr:phosphotransferase [Chitinolyticbacter albus]
MQQTTVNPAADADHRRNAIANWLLAVTGAAPLSLDIGGSDASVRRYWRACYAQRKLMVMDADPAGFDATPFLARQAELAAAGVRVPAVLAHDAALGLTLLEDLGSQELAPLLIDEASAKAWYLQAIDNLVALQSTLAHAHLPVFDAAFQRREMEIGREWYLGVHLGQALNDKQLAVWERSLALIIARNVAQPRVFMHRDYHSRNLMVVEGKLALLDFQDAVSGPISYDLVSLLRDAYVSWDEGFVLDLAIRYWEQARAAGLPVHEDFSEFYAAFEWQGLQRHLKVLGLFARLKHRDGKERYLADIPRVFGYVRGVCQRYSELTPLGRLLLDARGEKAEVGYTF